MIRTALLLLPFAAACGSKSTGSSEPAGNTGGAQTGAPLAVVLVEDAGEGSFTATLGPAEGARFPAVSADGTMVVHLVQDLEDFSGIPIATVVFWTAGGKGASFQLTSAIQEQVTDDQARLEDEAVTQINAELAKTTWSPIVLVEATGEDPDTGAPNTIDLGDGAVIELAAVAGRFTGLGSAAEGGECGEVIGLAHGFGSKALGFAIVFPRVNLGGDDCYGSPSADTALVVPL